MLERFRACYPTGCLISELITIHNGKYVVRVLVQVNGQTLASGLGAADTVELAEDQARKRSLAILPLDKSISTPQTSVQFYPTQSVSPPPSVSPPTPQTNTYINTYLEKEIEEVPPAISNLDTNEIPDSSTVLSLDVNEVPDSSTISSELEKSEIYTPVEKEELQVVESSINYDEIPYRIQNPSEFDNSWLETDYGTEQKEEKIDEATETLISSGNDNDIDSEITTSESIDSSVEIAQSIDNNDENYSLSSSYDVSNENVKIDILIDSLGWTKEQERDFLEQNYHQKTRQFLTTEELFNFHQYLDILLKVTKESKHQGWKLKQQQDYLEYSHNKESLEQLSVDELQSFLEYLEVFGKTTNEIKRLGWSPTKGKTYLKKNYGEEGRTRLSFEKLQDFLQHLEKLDTP
ncbi:MAG: hypothetical protein F6K25_00130 [Okeania sp. SIO2G4]|uniref:hypothetical protein n=1 Tax=unclassified Okeania TaxID=2634635 RepID=UPI0013BB3C17|nr:MULTISPECIES: hypothetical protein [unclassified Okeania]NEP41872.1 hypothetical protein [Okeania sp. SIO2H7]NEP70587.1 hypothetical protein [Okeania sp. SIO2G5]NEP93272.1 hypothetical protein [Okeania sp. SIO2F5]NEQ89244.1 hypothetical protein [Okeania sp. SIO2G4]